MRFARSHAAAALVAGTTLFAAVPTAVHAADWPAQQPIRLVVPSAAGGTPDLTSRKVAAFLQERLGQSFVVENRPGAAGIIAMQAVVGAKPDGYTLGFGNIVTMAINRSLLKRLPYDPDKDLVPVVAFTEVPNVLVVRQDLPVRSVAELIAQAKAKPGSLSMGSGGNGTSSHLSGEMLKQRADIDFAHIPYRGAPQAQNDLVGGRIDFMFDNLPSIVPAVQAGRVRALAVTSRQRSPLLPEVPTMQELGIKDFEVVGWGGIVVPAGTPAAIVERLNKEANAWLRSPEQAAEFAQNGQIVMGGTPAFFRDFIARESKKWAEVIRKGNVSVD